MALRIRLARGGAKKRPFYRIVVAEVTAPRDGRFVERLGSYNPMLPSRDKGRIVLDKARVEHWLSHGAKPSERMHKIMAGLGMMDKPTMRPQPKKSAPGKKRLEREEAAKEAAAKPEAEAKEAKPDAGDIQAEAKADAKPDATGDTQAEAKADAKPDATGDIQAEAKADAKPDATGDTQAEAKADASADDAKKE